MIATAETQEECDEAHMALNKVYTTAEGPSSMPPMPPPEPAAMEITTAAAEPVAAAVDKTRTEAETQAFVKWSQQPQPGTPTPGAWSQEAVHSPSSLQHHFECDPHPNFVIEARAANPMTGKADH